MAEAAVLQPGVRERGAVRVSNLPTTRQEMLDDLAETKRLARIKHQHGIALQAQRTIAELLGFMTEPPAQEEKIDPEVWRERICNAARAYGMVHRDEVKR